MTINSPPGTPAGRLRRAREAARNPDGSKKFKDMTAFAHALGMKPVTYRKHETGERNFDRTYAEKYAAALDCSSAWLHLGVETDEDSPRLARDPESAEDARAEQWIAEMKARGDDPDLIARAEDAMAIGTAAKAGYHATKSDVSDSRPLPPTDLMPRTIPIYGAAQGGDDGVFLDNGNIQGMAPTVPALAGVRGAFAFWLAGDSMEPRYFAGELCYVNPHKPVRPGDFVLVEMTDHRAFVKRLLRRTGSRIIVEQYNPPDRIEYAKADVLQIYRIVGNFED